MFGANREADLREADLSMTILIKTDLTGAVLPCGSSHQNGSGKK